MNLWSTFLELDELYKDSTFDHKNRLTEWKLIPTNRQGQTQNVQSAAVSQTTAMLHKSSDLVINNYIKNLSYHISELEDEGDAEDSIEYFENYPDIVAIVQAGSDIIIKLSAEPEDYDVPYWILTYALGEVGNDVAENNRYKFNLTEIIISEADFNTALSHNLK